MWNFSTKIALFFGKYCNNPVKYLLTNFNVICPYFDKLSKVKLFAASLREAAKSSLTGQAIKRKTLFFLQLPFKDRVKI